jgi:hypothetical protein
MKGWRASTPKLRRGARTRFSRPLPADVRQPAASTTIGASNRPSVVSTTPSRADLMRARRKSAPVRSKRSVQKRR